MGDSKSKGVLTPDAPAVSAPDRGHKICATQDVIIVGISQLRHFLCKYVWMCACEMMHISKNQCKSAQIFLCQQIWWQNKSEHFYGSTCSMLIENEGRI